MSEKQAERASLDRGPDMGLGMAKDGAEPVLNTPASPEVAESAVPAVAAVAQPMIAPDHEAPAADVPGQLVSETKPVVAEAAATKTEAKPEAVAMITEPANVEPAKIEPAKIEPTPMTHSEPAPIQDNAETIKAEPAKPETAKPETAKAEPAKMEAAKPAPAKPEPGRINLAKPLPGKSEAATTSNIARSSPTILDLMRTEPVKSPPIKTAAAGEPLKVDTPKLSSLAASAPKIGPMAATPSKSEIKPDKKAELPNKADVSAKPAATAKPEPVSKPELAAKPDLAIKPESAAPAAAAVKPDLAAKRPAAANVETAAKAGIASAAVDKATAWAKAKFKPEPTPADSAKTASPAAAAGAAAPQPGVIAAQRAAAARLGLPAMAAILLLAMVVGGVAGGLVTATFVKRSGGEVAGGTAETTTDPTLAATVARIDGDIAALKASLDQTNQTSLVELNKSAERIDRLEKILGELSTKSSAKPSELQRLSDAVERLRAAQASATAQQPATRDANASVPQAVGAINAAAPPAGVATRQEASRMLEAARAEAAKSEAAKSEAARAEASRAADAARAEASKPKVVDGWVLRDVGRGGALIEGRGGLYEVYAGDPVPGLGKVDAIRKQDGRWVVVTTKGLVVAR